MIIDVQRFIATEKPHWEELEFVLHELERDPSRDMSVDESKRFHYLYEKVSSDLAKISTYASEREIRGYLESLVARAYGEIHETREKPHRFSPIQWFLKTFPRTFRRHVNAFLLSLAVFSAGSIFGGAAVAFDPEAGEAIMPWPQLLEDPSKRVKREEGHVNDRLGEQQATFSAYLMDNNIRVSILAMALGMTWGVGTILMLFYNGVILGAISVVYMMAGETKFLFGWLLPHGAIEIPAILLGGQAGFVLANAMIGRGRRAPLGERLREISGDLMTLIFGVAVMLIWAGYVEAFLSQYHEPVIPYWLKIAFGTLELFILALFLTFSGRKMDRP
jgi:uncharacterized membrane protein SpoIIM required for sporulation